MVDIRKLFNTFKELNVDDGIKIETSSRGENIRIINNITIDEDRIVLELTKTYDDIDNDFIPLAIVITSSPNHSSTTFVVKEQGEVKLQSEITDVNIVEDFYSEIKGDKIAICEVK